MAKIDITGASPSRTWLDTLLKCVSLLGLVALCFMVGAAASYYKLFPYHQLDHAVVAARGWLKSMRGEPASFGRFMATAVTSPKGPAAVRPMPGADEPILIGGGPSENLAACPTFGCLAWIVDRKGAVLHKWEIDPEVILDGMSGYQGELKPAWLLPHDWHLQANGDLLVLFENAGTQPYGGSVARFDWDGRLLWALNNGAHHWMTIDRNGLMYMPTNRRVSAPLSFGDGHLAYACDDGAISVDAVQVVDPSGKPIETIDMTETLLRAGFEGLLWSTVDPCEPLHLNFVEIVDPDLAARSGLAAGDMIVSFRHVSALAVLAAGDRKVKWLLSGRTLHQHSPRIDADGSLLVFDNYGGRKAGGGSRIARVRIGSQNVTTVFPTGREPPDLGFFSRYGGLIQTRRGSTRVLVSLLGPGRILEIDLASGEVLWEYTKQFPSAGYPNADPDNESQRFVRVEAYGGYYVLDSAILARLGRV